MRKVRFRGVGRLSHRRHIPNHRRRRIRHLARTTAKKSTAKKSTAKKATARKTTTARKSTAKKTTARKVTTVPTARKVSANSFPSNPITPAVAAAPSFLASLVEDVTSFDLKALNLPEFDLASLELPEFDVQKAFADVTALSEKAGEFVTDLVAAAAKRGSEAVHQMNHGVTMVREAVGV